MCLPLFRSLFGQPAEVKKSNENSGRESRILSGTAQPSSRTMPSSGMVRCSGSAQPNSGDQKNGFSLFPKRNPVGRSRGKAYGQPGAPNQGGKGTYKKTKAIQTSPDNPSPVAARKPSPSMQKELNRGGFKAHALMNKPPPSDAMPVKKSKARVENTISISAHHPEDSDSDINILKTDKKSKSKGTNTGTGKRKRSTKHIRTVRNPPTQQSPTIPELRPSAPELSNRPASTVSAVAPPPSQRFPASVVEAAPEAEPEVVLPETVFATLTPVDTKRSSRTTSVRTEETDTDGTIADTNDQSADASQKYTD
uniref:Translation initiation factor IF-2 n=1 Tax=Panagrellus redivivus TaxID=6233 RepID=A0A7E4VCV3_PANRE